MKTFPTKWRKQIPRSAAIDLIVEVVDGEHLSRDQLRKAKKLVRARFQYAANKGKIPTAGQLNAPQLFSWAVTVSKWSQLRSVEDLPLLPGFGGAHVMLQMLATTAFTAFGHSVPQDRKELEQALSNAEVRAYKCLLENIELRKRLQAAEGKLRIFEERAAASKKKHSDAGRKGKGVSHRSN